LKQIVNKMSQILKILVATGTGFPGAILPTRAADYR
jgi:hypothetical protein